MFIYYHSVLIIMIESDYNKWLKNKEDIENFDKLSETLKKAIYKLEQELTDNEEVELSDIVFFEDIKSYELNFDWIGYGEECVRVGRAIYEGCEHDEDENTDYDDFYEIGEESVQRAGFEVMHEKISEYLLPHISKDSKELLINING